MILDRQLQFCDDLDVAGTGNLDSTDIVNLGVAGRDAGPGEPVYVWAQMTGPAVGGTSIQAQLLASAAADMSGAVVIFETPAIVTASLVAGYTFRLGSLPPGIKLQYLRMRFVRAGTFTGATGTISSALRKDLSQPYPV